MLEFSIGLSALSTSQRVLDLIGENIANANTPGYHRQVALLTEKDPTMLAGLMIGNGVQISQISRLRDFILEQASTQNTFQSASTGAQLGTLQQIEAALTPGTGSLDNLLAGFFNQVNQVASSPADMTQRTVLLGTATALTNQLNSLGANFASLRQSVDSQLQQTVTDANSLLPQIAALNQEIQRVEVLGTNANDQRDQRDQLINQLAGLVDVRTIEQPYGQTTVLVDGSPAVIGNQANKLQFTADQTGKAIVTMAGSSTPLNLVGGKLAGLLQIRNQTLSDFSNRLD